MLKCECSTVFLDGYVLHFWLTSCFCGVAGLGLMVTMDIVHSHAAPNEGNGLASFDGANDCYFYPGGYEILPIFILKPYVELIVAVSKISHGHLRD